MLCWLFSVNAIISLGICGSEGPWPPLSPTSRRTGLHSIAGNNCLSTPLGPLIARWIMYDLRWARSFPRASQISWCDFMLVGRSPTV